MRDDGNKYEKPEVNNVDSAQLTDEELSKESGGINPPFCQNGNVNGLNCRTGYGANTCGVGSKAELS